ncbi:hypothetical protein BGX38DRAFT_1272845 [Terfezia claveryi]|nr:hypothetical protein BGX38DRAFT_1272845 [Terfezia claveryi]
MSTNSRVENLLKAELTEFLKVHRFLAYEDGTRGRRWCMLMNSRLAEEIVHSLIKLIVEKWMENGITKMSELESTQGMNLLQVQEHGEGLNWYILPFGD